MFMLAIPRTSRDFCQSFYKEHCNCISLLSRVDFIVLLNLGRDPKKFPEIWPRQIREMNVSRKCHVQEPLFINEVPAIKNDILQPSQLLKVQ